MPRSDPATTATRILDVRGMRKPDKHPTIFATFRDLAVGASFVLVNGVLVTEVGQIALAAGEFVHVPGGATRGFTAGEQGLRVLLVQRRREELPLG